VSSAPSLLSGHTCLMHKLKQRRHTSCATDAAIWTEQQLVAIPGWLHEDQNARSHQEEHFASIKQPRSPKAKENEAKRRIPCCGVGGTRWRPKPFPPTLVATFCPETASFQGNWRVFKSTGGFLLQIR
jgi:hypothetical protein